MNKKIIIKADENKFIPIFWDGLDKEIDYNIILSAPGATLSLLGLLIGRGDKEVNIKINVTHEAPNTKSEIILKGALQDESKVSFEGLVKIKKEAKGTNTWMATHLLILSDHARGRAIPSLEIEENDIKAGHAATVGRVNDLELFYMQSRGLSATQAKNLIVEGFLSSVIQKLPKNLQAKALKSLVTNN